MMTASETGFLNRIMNAYGAARTGRREYGVKFCHGWPGGCPSSQVLSNPCRLTIGKPASGMDHAIAWLGRACRPVFRQVPASDLKNLIRDYGMAPDEFPAELPAAARATSSMAFSPSVSNCSITGMK